MTDEHRNQIVGKINGTRFAMEANTTTVPPPVITTTTPSNDLARKVHEVETSFPEGHGDANNVPKRINATGSKAPWWMIAVVFGAVVVAVPLYYTRMKNEPLDRGLYNFL